jgi:hypothetical protein
MYSEFVSCPINLCIEKTKEEKVSDDKYEDKT